MLTALAVGSPAARAADQATSDPDDAYALASGGQSDIGSVEWATGGDSVTLTVRMEMHAQFDAFTWIDVDRNGRADYVAVLDGGSGSTTFDAELRAVPRSTTTCQLLVPGDGSAALIDTQLAYKVDASGFAALSFAFPASVIAGAGSFTWAAFGLTPNGLGAPGWDYAPDAAHPAPPAAQPADRSCVVPKTPGFEDAPGQLVDMTHGVAFPTPAAGDLPPTAGFSVTPPTPLSGETITLQSTSSDPEGPLASQRWDLDADGLYDDATGAQATTSFPRRGPHTVSILVEDSAGATATASQVIAVGSRPPVVTIAADPDPAQPGFPVTLRSTSTDDGEITGYEWDTDQDGIFDEGATGAFVVRSYPTKGTRTIRLRVTDDNGMTAVGSFELHVANRPPVASLRVSPTSPRVDQMAAFDASGSFDPDGDSLLYAFDSGGGFGAPSGPRSGLTGGLPRHVLLRVRVTDGDGGEDIAELPVDFVAPPPLRIAFTAPDPAVVVLGDSAQVRGTWSRTGSPPTGFCLTVGPVTSIPSDCGLTSLLRTTDGAFGPITVDALEPGLNRVTAWIRDAYGQVSSAVIVLERVGRTSGLDLRAGSIEVSQGPQFERLPVPRDGVLGAERIADYDGVKLAIGGPTYARVFANARSLARGGARPRGVTALLHGYSAGGRELPGSPVSPLDGPREVALGPFSGAPVADRRSPRGAFVFALPDAWTRAPELRLDAAVNPYGSAPWFPECDTCLRDNVFSLRRILFFSPPFQVIVPLRLVSPSSSPPPSAVALDALRRLSPGGPATTDVEDYRGAAIDITGIEQDESLDGDEKNVAIYGVVADWELRNDAAGYTVGVNTGVAKGYNAPTTFFDPFRIEAISIVNTQRPVGSVAHEVFHGYGFFHASPCSIPGRDGPGPLVDGWPPDERGLLQGYALDVRPGSGGADGPFRVIGPDGYDLMSYCSDGEESLWLSARNWNRRLGGPISQAPAARAAAAPRARSAQTGSLLHVTAAASRDGSAQMLTVEPAEGGAARAAANPQYRFVVRDAAGAIVSSTGAAVSVLESHGEPGPSYLSAIVPAAGAASIELTGPDGRTLARRAASPASPVVKVAAPRVRGGSLRVRWSAADADAGALSTRVDLAVDGHSFRTVAVVSRGAEVAVPLAGRAGGRAARVRVAVNDGFHETVGVSPPFRLRAGAPVVRIVDPGKAARLTSDSAVVLRGEAATDARPRPKLRWYAGRRLLGRGAVLTVPGLPAGRVKLRLRAGRGSASVTVRVAAATPRLIELRAPRRLSRSARRITLRVAANQPSQLRVAGRRYRVGRGGRRIVVAVPRGRRAVHLRLRLTAAHRTTTIPLSVPRG